MPLDPGALAGAFAGFALALALTISFELPVAFLFGFRDARSLAVIALVNAVTNPLLNYLVLAAGIAAPGSVGIGAILALEFLVVIVEWKILAHAFIGRRNLFTISAAMNAVSFLAGIVLLGA